MKWIKDALADIKVVVLAPLMNILCAGGIFLLLGSFFDYDNTQGLSLHGNPHWIMVVFGLVLIVAAIIIFILTHDTGGTRTRLDYDKGMEIKRDDLKIIIKKGEIQSIHDTTRNSAIVLPANTTFIDTCASDARSAMGAFFTTHFPEEIGQLPSELRKFLDSIGIQAENDAQYPTGTTVLLPDRFAKPARIIITASTIRTPGSGIVSNPQIICKCIDEILKATADQRIDTLYLPILGSGHGGVDCGLALLFLLFAVLHSSKTYHHIKVVHIVVHSKDVDRLNHSKELSRILTIL
jgi:hypothetical protein